MPRAALLLTLPLLAALGCRAADDAAAPPAGELRAIEATLEELYRAFCFDAGGEADWETMRSLFADGAAFVTPGGDGSAPRVAGVDAFLSDFRAYVASTPVRETGLHERIVHARIDVFGRVAHAWVVFEGFVPGEAEARRRGLDSLQLVRDGERWSVVSFSTEEESAALPLPARFLAGG